MEKPSSNPFFKIGYKFILNIFSSREQIYLVILGILAGMPLLLIFSTFGAWFVEYNLSAEIISMIAIARWPYSLKFLWSPIIDFVKIPFLTDYFGKRKSWMIFCTIVNSFLLFMVSSFDPVQNYKIIIAVAFFLGIFSATYDMAFDSYRIQLLDDEKQGLGTANTVLGYRISRVFSVVSMLILSEYIGWNYSLKLLSIFILIFVIFIAYAPVVKFVGFNDDKISFNKNFISNLKNLYWIPIKEILLKNKGVFLILGIMSFKLGEVYLGMFTIKFFDEIGYSKSQIALVGKIFGLFTAISGAYFGAYIVAKLGVFRGLIICGIFQMLSNFSFIWLNHQPITTINLAIAIFIEDFTGGMGTTALVAFLSSICSKQYSAIHYSVLSVLTTFANNILSIFAGNIFNFLGSWDNYFIFTIIIALPSILIFIYLNQYLNRIDHADK